jgi:RNA polymerase sigma-70 factor (ECF subfamily)
MNLQQIPEVGDSSAIDPSSPDMLRDLVLKAMKSVRVEFRVCSWKAFWRTAVDGLPTDMVANELGMSVAAIRQARSRIMRRLREELGDC